MESSVSAWLLLLVAVHKICGPGSQTEAADSVPPVPPFSGPSHLPTVPGNITPQNGFYPVDTVSTDFESPFPMPSHMSHVLSIMDDNDANEIVAHDTFYSYMEEKPHLTASSLVNSDIPSHSIHVSSLPAELSATPVQVAQEPEASVNFMLPHQAMDNYISHADTMIPSSLDVASSLPEDHSPLLSITSFSPAAPVLSSPTLSKMKSPRVTTTTTRSTTTTTRRKKGASVPETKDDSFNATIESKTTHDESASPDLLLAKFTSSTSSTTTTTTTTRLTWTTGTITTTTTTIRTSLGSTQTRNVCTLFQFFVNQFLRTLSRCQELVGSDESEKQQMQEKTDTPTGESTKHENVDDDLDFTFESLADQFFFWADSLLQWLTAMGRTLQSDAHSSHDIFLKMSPEKAL